MQRVLIGLVQRKDMIIEVSLRRPLVVLLQIILCLREQSIALFCPFISMKSPICWELETIIVSLGKEVVSEGLSVQIEIVIRLPMVANSALILALCTTQGYLYLQLMLMSYFATDVETIF